MSKQKEQLESLHEIRSLMERSSRFLSISGFTGIIVGVIAIAGIALAYIYLGLSVFKPVQYNMGLENYGDPSATPFKFLLIDAGLVFLLSIIITSALTIKKARRQRQPLWDATAKRVLINLCIPMLAGGIYCSILFYHNYIALIAPASLIFYGLALLNTSKYTLTDIRYLGILEIILGLCASLFVAYGLIFWALGFGVLHIVYGIHIYIKYDR